MEKEDTKTALLIRHSQKGLPCFQVSSTPWVQKNEANPGKFSSLGPQNFHWVTSSNELTNKNINPKRMPVFIIENQKKQKSNIFLTPKNCWYRNCRGKLQDSPAHTALKNKGHNHKVGHQHYTVRNKTIGEKKLTPPYGNYNCWKV